VVRRNESYWIERSLIVIIPEGFYGTLYAIVSHLIASFLKHAKIIVVCADRLIVA
jgi:hypothetical protein